MERISIKALLLLLCFVAMVACTCDLTGVNLSGAEFGSGDIPGAIFHNYVWDGPKDAQYFVNKGMNYYRVPFLWERLQTVAGGALEEKELQFMFTLVNFLTEQNNMYVMLDPHNYGRGFGGKIGQSATSITLYADFWYKLALEFKNNSKVIFGLMNEPNGQDVHIWRNAAQRAIYAIRFAGASNLITVPGVDWTGAHSWMEQNAAVMNVIDDPADNYIYEVHQYLDIDSSGTHNTCVSADVGWKALVNFTSWARKLGKKAILGEFGGGPDPLCGAALNNMLGYMDNNTDVWMGWTYWSGGPWWGDWYFSNLTPNSTGQDRPQMKYVQPHISPSTPKPTPHTPGKGSYTPPQNVKTQKTIYSNGKTQNGFVDYSWAHHDLCNSSVVRPGSGDSCSLSFDLSAYGALWFQCAGCLNVSSWFSLSFWYNPGNSSGVDFGLFMVNTTGNSKVSSHVNLDLPAYSASPVITNQWVYISVPLGWFNQTVVYNGFQLQGNKPGDVPLAYLSDVELVAYPDQYTMNDGGIHIPIV